MERRGGLLARQRSKQTIDALAVLETRRGQNAIAVRRVKVIIMLLSRLLDRAYILLLIGIGKYLSR